MSRVTLRAGIVSWLTAPPIVGLTTVYRSYPKLNPAQAFIPNPGATSGAVGVLFIGSEDDQREAYGGWKRCTHMCELHVFFRSNEQAAEDAMDAYDAMVDAILTRLRGDQGIGAAVDHTWAGTAWSVGESSNPGEIDITAQHGEPVLTAGITEIEGSFGFKAIEQIQTI